MDILKKIFPFLIFTAGVVSLSRALLLDTYPDFRTYYYGPQVFLLGQNPYRPGEGFTEFLYPPYALLFFMPLSFFPYELAGKLWVALSVVLLFISVLLLNAAVEGRKLFKNTLVIFGLAGLSFPIKFTLGMGQSNVLLLFFVTVAIWFFYKKREYFSGFLLGLAFALKPFPVLLLPYFIFLQRWRFVTLTVIVFIIVNMFSLLFMETHIFTDYFSYILPSTALSWKADYYNQALSGFVARLIADEGLRNFIRLLGTLCFLGLTAFVIWSQRKRKKRLFDIEIGLVVAVSLLINSFSWQHHFVFLLVPFTFLFHRYIKERPDKWQILFFLVSFGLVATNLAEPDSYPVLLQSHVFYGTVILWFLLIVRLRKKYV